MTTSSILIGSIEGMPARSLSVNIGGAEGLTVAAGDYYLVDPTTSLSLLSAVKAGLESHSSGPSFTVEILESRRVRIANASDPFTVTWTDTALRDALGFTGDLTPSGQTFTATNPSPYLWAAGKTESPMEAILGVAGRRIKDTRYGQSGLSGRIVTTTNDTRVQNRFQWLNVLPAYYWTTSELGGEWQTFWDTVVSEGLRFKLYRNKTIDDASTTVQTWTSPIGPYKFRPPSGPARFDIERAEQFLDDHFRVELPVAVSPEYS